MKSLISGDHSGPAAAAALLAALAEESGRVEALLAVEDFFEVSNVAISAYFALILRYGLPKSFADYALRIFYHLEKCYM